MEVWLVLLRCYAAPELYGPASLDPLDAFRCHRSLRLRIVEARRLNRPLSSGDSMREKEMDTYCEVSIEGEIRGKTSVKRGTLRPRWNEDFEFMYSTYIRLLCPVTFLSTLTMLRSISDKFGGIEIPYWAKSR